MSTTMSSIRELTDSLRISRNPSSTRQKAISETMMERAAMFSKFRSSSESHDLSEEKYASDDTFAQIVEIEKSYNEDRFANLLELE